MPQTITEKIVAARAVEGGVAPGAIATDPALAETYRPRVEGLTKALDAEDASEAREVVRGLVEAIRLVPEEGRQRIEVRGETGAILRLAEGARNDKRLGSVAEAFVVQIKMDAGTRNRRCQYIAVAI
jgi:hypothetical protein